MFDSQMQEAATHRIVIKHAIVDQFREFYQIMLPLVGCKVVISSTSIDNLLTLSDYYQVQSLEDECVACLAKVEAKFIGL